MNHFAGNLNTTVNITTVNRPQFIRYSAKYLETVTIIAHLRWTSVFSVSTWSLGYIEIDGTTGTGELARVLKLKSNFYGSNSPQNNCSSIRMLF